MQPSTDHPVLLDPAVAARAAAATRPDRPATAVLVDSPDVRMIVFRLGPGQRVPPHRSPSTVVLQVLEGAGVISGPDGERAARPGQVAAFEPQELHGMRATDAGEVLILATIAPRPGER
ncbi:MAG TPA: cupin domain-containing protein [Gemmatimonadaceae bacterium]|nr:cupin domain-containing protein [Gemmatimonadaceae bacterium]